MQYIHQSINYVNAKPTYLVLRSRSPSIFQTFKTLSSPLTARCTFEISTAAHRTCPDVRTTSFALPTNLAVECSTWPVLGNEIRIKCGERLKYGILCFDDLNVRP
jgi:hypothetical protein